MTTGQIIALLREAGFTPREIIEAVKDGTFSEMASLVADAHDFSKRATAIL